MMKQHLAIWAGSALLATGALVACGPGDQQEPGTPPETEQTAPDDTAADDNMAMYEPEDAGDASTPAEDPMADDPSTTADSSYGPEGESDETGGDLASMADDEIVGKAIVSRDGEEIGDVDEVVVDGTTGQKFVVVDVGGFLGVGEKSIVIAMDELEAGTDERIQSDLTRETLQTQTEYDPSYFEKPKEEEKEPGTY